MPGLFNSTERQQILDRIAMLSPAATPLWGKMSAAQMLAHCQAPVQVALGELQLKQSFIGKLFGKIAKRKMLNSPDISRNLPTAPQFIVRDNREFESERAKLSNMVKRFAAGPSVLSKDPHPFFGNLTIDEWDHLQWKHLDHHLKQFGV